MNQEKIGKFIASSRKNKHLTQEQLAHQLGISTNAVSKWERGLNLPDVSLMKDLCGILDITLNELFEGEKLSDQDAIVQSEKNIMSLFYTKDQIETYKLLNEILIVVAIIITITFRIVLAHTLLEEIIVTVCGSFVWIYGLFLRSKMNKILMYLENE